MAFENFVSKTAFERSVWAQFDALNLGTSWDEEDLTKPQILVEDVWGDSHPGSYHLNRLTEEARIGVYEKGIKAGDIMTPAAFRNAIIVHTAIGGSTNATIHLPSIAKELGIDLEPELFDEINRIIPHLCNIYPSGKYFSEDLWFAGGVPMVQWILRDYLDLNVMTCTGKTLGENLEDVQKDDFFNRNIGYLHNYGLEREDVIVPVEKAEIGSLAILRGNIAPGGACIGHISPEAASGGPLAYVHTGDIIAYDIPNRTLNLVGIDGVECGAEKAAKVLAQRAQEEEIVPRPPRKGLYRRYTTHALSAMEGAGY